MLFLSFWREEGINEAKQLRIQAWKQIKEEITEEGMLAHIGSIS